MLTVMPNSASSSASDFVSPISPALPAEYKDAFASPTAPLIEPIDYSSHLFFHGRTTSEHNS